MSIHSRFLELEVHLEAYFLSILVGLVVILRDVYVEAWFEVEGKFNGQQRFWVVWVDWGAR